VVGRHGKRHVVALSVLGGRISPALSDSSPKLTFRLLDEFQKLFQGRVYKHRASNQGDYIAMHLYEDLVEINRSPKLVAAVKNEILVLNVANRLQGIRARRGDGTFGEVVPGEIPIRDVGYAVARGKIATVEIGVEVKILAKAMIKQIDRVINDLRNQVVQFRRGGAHSFCVGVVGINQADHYVSFEGDRPWPTTGKGGYLHPIQEAAEAERRLIEQAAPLYNEFLILRYRATNENPYPFEWSDFNETRLNYAAVLTRISSAFQQKL
jgi:hypothetical protein